MPDRNESRPAHQRRQQWCATGLAAELASRTRCRCSVRPSGPKYTPASPTSWPTMPPTMGLAQLSGNSDANLLFSLFSFVNSLLRAGAGGLPMEATGATNGTDCPIGANGMVPIARGAVPFRPIPTNGCGEGGNGHATVTTIGDISNVPRRPMVCRHDCLLSRTSHQ